METEADEASTTLGSLLNNYRWRGRGLGPVLIEQLAITSTILKPTVDNSYVCVHVELAMPYASEILGYFRQSEAHSISTVFQISFPVRLIY